MSAFARRTVTLGLALSGAAFALGVAWLLGPGAAWWLTHVDGVRVGGPDGLKGKELADALDTIRGRALALGTGLLAAVAIYYTASNAASARRSAQAAQQMSLLAEHSQLTGRYTAAIEQLGSDRLEIRLGGIYALERIARDSPRDHQTVMEVLAAFLRNPSPLAEPPPRRPSSPQARPRLRADLQAALTVLARRDTDHDTSGIDLAETDLTGADLADARMAGFDLAQADLTDADLRRADLTGANLWHANLTRTNLSNANLTNAILEGADLDRAVGLSGRA